jgi:hypothetical protein
MMDAGHVTPHEMATHPHRHVVMHSLGGPVDRVVWPVGPVVIGTKWLQSWNASSQLWNGELDTLANVVAEQDASTLDGLFALRVVRVSSDDATMDDVGVEQ